MCGLLGEYSFNNSLSSSQSFLELLSRSKHRGPDSTNISHGENYRLGFNRLALLDISAAGEQPKISPSKRYHVVFNGEIYNYKELKEQYQLQDLDSTSDTEVVLNLLDQIGVVKTIEQLNGMFAIGIVDQQEGEVYLTRDFAGIKPLFFGINDEGLVFASQFDQIFKHPWFHESLVLRPSIIKEFFAFGYMQAPNTIYENIFQVNPGELLKFDGNGKITRTVILHFDKKPTENFGYDLNSIKDAIKKSVKLQLNSDRSLATFLSGGIDSSLVASYAKELKEDIEAFTLKIDNPQLNESEFAKEYANHLDLKHTIVEIKEDELLAKVDEHLNAFSDPFGDYSSIPTYMVTQKAAEFHTAMLSGDGGDELFCGYPRMYDAIRKAWWFNLPYFFRTNLVRITNKLGITDTYAPFAKNLQEFWMNKHEKLPSKILKAFKVGYSPEMDALYDINRRYNKKELQHFLRWNEFYAHMQRVLIKVDRTSMKHSLEVRVPLLDKTVIEESWMSFFSIENLKNLKKPLKELVEQVIPEHLLMKEKRGFSVPIEKWLRNQLKPDLTNTVLNSDIYGNECFDQAVLKKYVVDFLDNKHNNGWGVWHIYAWQKWADKFVRKE